MAYLVFFYGPDARIWRIDHFLSNYNFKEFFLWRHEHLTFVSVITRHNNYIHY